jgi:hypothetical protein
MVWSMCSLWAQAAVLVTHTQALIALVLAAAASCGHRTAST